MTLTMAPVRRSSCAQPVPAQEQRLDRAQGHREEFWDRVPVLSHPITPARGSGARISPWSGLQFSAAAHELRPDPLLALFEPKERLV